MNCSSRSGHAKHDYQCNRSDTPHDIHGYRDAEKSVQWRDNPTVSTRRFKRG